MSTEKALINVELTKPVTVLIEKISDAVHGLFRPMQVVRMAKADAKAKLIGVQAEIAATDLTSRAINRFVEEEAKRQANIESIAAGAIELLLPDAVPEKLSDDWVVNFFDKCRIVSDEDMQAVWSKLLAGEANCPGSFSRKTVNVVTDFESNDAALFLNLCRFYCEIGGKPCIYISDVTSALELYTNADINYSVLQHLDSLGLIVCSGLTFSTEIDSDVDVVYYGQKFTIACPPGSHELDLGVVSLTVAGIELSRISMSQPYPGNLEHMQKSLVPFPRID